ncbi:hypothetical protein [Krasilnikovia sp. MM14-A1259]|uniref:hypothetical protein n=1 Tax=Krasilnikovia sp. MM14-A1259 TaxID=3373539 RepID=UPI00380DC5A9
MSTEQPAPGTPDQRRATALRTIADLAIQHGLPVPMQISFSGTVGGCELTLDPNSRDAVSAWAQVLGLGEPTDSGVLDNPRRQFVAVRAEKWAMDSDSPLWLGFGRVGVWSAVDVEDAGRCARCRGFFDPADSSPEGLRQYRDTAFCWGCVSDCHENTELGHECAVCRSYDEAPVSYDLSPAESTFDIDVEDGGRE